MPPQPSAKVPNHSDFTTLDCIKHIWQGLDLPSSALTSLNLEDDGSNYPSSFKIGHLAQSSIALSALSASLVHSLRRPSTPIPTINVPRRHALLEFQVERLFSIDGKPPESAWGPIGGLHATSDGYVRIHDSFPHHRQGALELLELDGSAGREAVSERVGRWKKLDLEEAAYRRGLVIYALRSYAEWDALPHAALVADFPIRLERIGQGGPTALPANMMKPNPDRCLRGLRVLELSRVIAAPVAGKTLAAHGADVLWVTSPNLPDLPALDKNLSRGKRSIQLDLNDPKDAETMRRLVRDCDVFIQGYRPGGLAGKGFGFAELAALRPGIIVANLSAFGRTGPWSDRRGFDSLVQTCTGMNVSEAEHFNTNHKNTDNDKSSVNNIPARPMPCQALDFGAGYLLSTAICAALYKRAEQGGSWEVDVSLAGVMKFLRGLGQWEGKTGFEDAVDPAAGDVPGRYFEERMSGFGRLRGLRHAASVERLEPGWDFMPRGLGSDEARWL